MDYRCSLTLNVYKSKLDYIRGLGSIYAVPASKIIEYMIELCFKNHDTFIEFLKQKIEEKKVTNEKQRQNRDSQGRDEGDD